jgi:hypothetical protein
MGCPLVPQCKSPRESLPATDHRSSEIFVPLLIGRRCARQQEIIGDLAIRAHRFIAVNNRQPEGFTVHSATVSNNKMTFKTAVGCLPMAETVGR